MGTSENIHDGMEVYGSDDRLIGTVERRDDRGIYVSGRSIPQPMIVRVEGDRVYLREPGARYLADTGERLETEGEIRVPEVAERLDVEKRAGQVGEVRVHREVTEEEQSIPVDLNREEVHVERRDVDDRPLTAGEAAGAFEEGTIRVPVRGEEAIVNKESVVTGEVAISKEQTTERQEVRDTVRRQHVEVDEDYERERPAFQQHFEQRYGTDRTSTFDEMEPHYRWGWQAGRDSRFAGREFDDVEPDLRREYQTAGYTDDEWERLREQIREGWSRVRGR